MFVWRVHLLFGGMSLLTFLADYLNTKMLSVGPGNAGRALLSGVLGPSGTNKVRQLDLCSLLFEFLLYFSAPLPPGAEFGPGLCSTQGFSMYSRTWYIYKLCSKGCVGLYIVHWYLDALHSPGLDQLREVADPRAQTTRQSDSKCKNLKKILMPVESRCPPSFDLSQHSVISTSVPLEPTSGVRMY